MDYLSTHISVSPIRRMFAHGFVNYKKWCTQLSVIEYTSCLPMVGGSRRVLRLLPPLKLVAEILLKVALNTINLKLNLYIYIYVCINNVLYDNKTGHDEVHFLNTLWKGSLNSDGQQFHQFQRKTNKNFSPQIIEYKNTMKYVVRNSCLGLGQAQQCCGVCMWYMQGIFSYFFFRIVCRCSLHILQNERICPLHSWSLNCFCHLSRIKMIFLSKFYF